MNEHLTPEILSYIFNNMDDAVCVIQKNGMLLYLNPAASELFGISPESVRKNKIWEAIPRIKRNDKLMQVFIDAIMVHSKTQQALVPYENNEKQVFQLWVNIAYTNDQDGMFVIVISDLTRMIRINAALERYTSPDIADFVLNDPKGEKQGGRSKEVTVLMSDLRGFTALSAGLNADQMIKCLNHYFEKMVSVIEKNQGTVIEILGDGIFVVFGAPKDDRDHAGHAVNCAVDMQNAMKSVNEWNVQKGFPVLEMGIGINSGPAVVGNIGSKQKMKYGVMGYTVNLAGRIESLTVGGQIFISENTSALLGEDLQINVQNDIMLKGAKKPLTVFDIKGLGKNCLSVLADNEVKWQKVSFETQLHFYLLDGKLVKTESHTGCITALSEFRRSALLQTDCPLNIGDNIMIQTDIDVYAKVTGQQDKEWIISFTMRPDGFSDWIDNLVGV